VATPSASTAFTREIEITSIRHEIDIDAPPEAVWDAIRDVGAVHRRLLPGRVTETTLDGDVRTLTFPHGGVVRELIVGIDDASRRLAYAVVGGSRMALTHHHASFQVVADGSERSRLVWITDVLPHALADEVRERMVRGAEEMRRTLEG
jgi:carbon monoxide dehydrogenase subunit G